MLIHFTAHFRLPPEADRQRLNDSTNKQKESTANFPEKKPIAIRVNATSREFYLKVGSLLKKLRV
jgi:hypothetical protein